MRRRLGEMAACVRPTGELAADDRCSGRAFHVNGDRAGGRLHGAGREFGLRGRCAVRLHDAQHAGGAATRGLARLIEDYEQVAAAITEAASVLNRPPEANTGSGALVPLFAGAIAFED